MLAKIQNASQALLLLVMLLLAGSCRSTEASNGASGGRHEEDGIGSSRTLETQVHALLALAMESSPSQTNKVREMATRIESFLMNDPDHRNRRRNWEPLRLRVLQMAGEHPDHLDDHRRGIESALTQYLNR